MIMLHVDIIYLAYRGQKYITIIVYFLELILDIMAFFFIK